MNHHPDNNSPTKPSSGTYTILAGCDEDCPLCSGEACDLCGAGGWSDKKTCEHDLIERHKVPNDEVG